MKGYTQNWLENVFIICKITVPWAYVISDLNGEKIDGTFYEKELQKTDQQEFRIEEMINRKGDKLNVKCKGYDNSFTSWPSRPGIKMNQYFPRPFRSFGGNINVKVDHSIYATRTNLTR